MSAELTFRPITHTDLPEVLAIEQQVYENPWTKQAFSDSIGHSGGGGVIVVDGHIIGYGITSQVLDEAQLLNLAIAPCEQGSGVGRYLLNQLLKQVQTNKVNRLFLEVRISNLRAIALYQKAGFVDVGYRKNYYRKADTREDARVMAVTLQTHQHLTSNAA